VRVKSVRSKKSDVSAGEKVMSVRVKNDVGAGKVMSVRVNDVGAGKK